MVKPRGKNAKRQAIRKQQLRGEADAKLAKGVPLSPSPPLSALPRGALDLYIVSDAANEVPSGEHPMGNHTADAASSPPGELSRVLVAIVTRELSSATD
jgi:hypothetical protein